MPQTLPPDKRVIALAERRPGDLPLLTPRVSLRRDDVGTPYLQDLVDLCGFRKVVPALADLNNGFGIRKGEIVTAGRSVYDDVGFALLKGREAAGVVTPLASDDAERRYQF